ncbi:hypothetical protein [Egicoccus sp. AB-alg6-2]|uniref:hypothetical protein n=1 Tax=Egicoccus sp. AB-alg6-2 TaxID=3242692 RepID=UPI00359DF58C
MRRPRLLTTLVAATLLAACSGGPEGTDESDAPPPRGDDSAVEEQDPTAAGEACAEAFAQAAAGDGELEAAIGACEDIASFTSAAAEHPDALGDVEPQVWLADACTEATDPAVTESALCAEVAGEQS